MITEQAPGKLYIAGEYAVLETNNPAIIVAVNEFVKVSIEQNTTSGSIHSKQYSQDSVHWTRQGAKLVIDNRENPFHYILSAIKYAETYVYENGGKLAFYDLTVNSELDSKDGKKYGLGSSAAVTVATVKAVLSFYKIPLDNDLVFKLAAIAHWKVQGNGSLGDIAASVFGGWLAYQSFDKKWLDEQLETTRLTDLVSVAWPKLKIQLLVPPKNLKLVIGWSQKPALTAQLVDQTDQEKAYKRVKYQKFVTESRKCVLKIIEGFETENIALIKEQIEYNRLLLHSLAQISNIQIEIPRLTKLIEIAEANSGAAKTSGAGNGDCGIVIADENTNIAKMKQEWRKNGIMPLNFEVHSLR